MDQDIQFGDLEEAAPRSRLRPDCNKQFAVVAYGEPSEEDLPVFVDMDVMRDMEEHALSNTDVELGGVLLGGQYQDEEGRPFVVISDSLRAEHYESTKGSFKFTHDTWSAITRQRDEFPEDVQMVGWYHTHPDWGVFLSGMDMFICDNFFSKPLDVALVIDPCRGDRGIFQWTGDITERVRRISFYLTASRFRKEELEWFAAQLEGVDQMASPRFGPSGPYPAPVVNISENRSPWQAIAVVGMLTAQFVLLTLIAWRMLLPPTPEEKRAPDNSQELADQRELLDDVIDKLDVKLDVAPDGLVQSLEKARKDAVKSDVEKQALYARINELDRENDKEKLRQLTLGNKLKDLEKSYDKLKSNAEEQDDEIAALKKRLARYEPDADDEKQGFDWWDWRWWTAGAIVLVLIVASLATVVSLRRQDDEPFEDEYVDEPPPDPEQP